MINVLEHLNGRGPEDNPIPLGDILSGAYNPVIVEDKWVGGDPVVGTVMEFVVQPYDGTDLSMNPANFVVGQNKMIPLRPFTAEELANATQPRSEHASTTSSSRSMTMNGMFRRARLLHTIRPIRPAPQTMKWSLRSLRSPFMLLLLHNSRSSARTTNSPSWIIPYINTPRPPTRKKMTNTLPCCESVSTSLNPTVVSVITVM